MTKLPGLTKLDVAQREINAAVQMLFDGGDPVAVCVLASAARGIVTTLCEKQGVRSFFDDLKEEFPDRTKRDLFNEANKHANFFKHANDDAEAVLEGFTAGDADMILFCATYDFGSICKGKSIEAQVFEGWFLYLYGAEAEMPSGLAGLFPKLRELPRAAQLALGKEVIEWARTQPDFEMVYSLEFRLPSTGEK